MGWFDGEDWHEGEPPHQDVTDGYTYADEVESVRLCYTDEDGDLQYATAAGPFPEWDDAADEVDWYDQWVSDHYG